MNGIHSNYLARWARGGQAEKFIPLGVGPLHNERDAFFPSPSQGEGTEMRARVVNDAD